tara:strand:+ start:12400 stop:12921 length:522 start_codon:yes stop_codon:yes gene_type:complete
MKQILLITICLFISTEVQANYRGSDRDLYNLPQVQVNGLLSDCEKYYPEYYPKTHLPDRYYTLDNRRKLHFCMRKLIQTGDVYDESWYRMGNMKDSNEQRYEREVGEFPDEYYLITKYSEKMEFIGKGLDKKYADDDRKKRKELKDNFGLAANIVGFFNPILGWAFTGVGSVQ